MYAQTINLGSDIQSLEGVLLGGVLTIQGGHTLNEVLGNHVVIVQNVGTSPLYVGSQASLAEPPQSGRPHGLKIDVGKELRLNLSHDQAWITCPSGDGAANIALVVT